MEPLNPNLKPLVTKLTYMSYLMQYYGYLHRSASLFKSLCKESREEWNGNLDAILNVIMGNENNKITLYLKDPEKVDFERYIIKNHYYLNFWLKFELNTVGDCEKIIKFLEDADILPKNLILGILFTATEDNGKLLDRIFKMMAELNLMENCIICSEGDTYLDFMLEIDSPNFIYKSPMMLDSLLQFCRVGFSDIVEFYNKMKELKNEEILKNFEQNPLEEITNESFVVFYDSEINLNSVLYKELILNFHGTEDLSNIRI